MQHDHETKFGTKEFDRTHAEELKKQCAEELERAVPKDPMYLGEFNAGLKRTESLAEMEAKMEAKRGPSIDEILEMKRLVNSERTEFEEMMPEGEKGDPTVTRPPLVETGISRLNHEVMVPRNEPGPGARVLPMPGPVGSQELARRRIAPGPIGAAGLPGGRRTDLAKAIIPGTTLTVADAERLENAAQNAVALGQLYAGDRCVVAAKPGEESSGSLVPRLPAELTSALAKISNILAGPGPIALDRRPNSVEIHGDPVLHEKALLEAKAREMALGMVKPETAAAAELYDERQEAHLNDVAQAFQAKWDDPAFDELKAGLRQEGVNEGYITGSAHGDMAGYERGCGVTEERVRREVRSWSLWQHLVSWWRSRA